MNTYLLCKSVITNDKYGSQEEMQQKLDVFLLNNRITTEQYDELIALMSGTV